MKDAQKVARITLRLPAEVWESLQEIAQQAFHSTNAEIVDRLMKSLNEDKQNAAN